MALADEDLTQEFCDNLLELVDRLPFFIPDEQARHLNALHAESLKPVPPGLTTAEYVALRRPGFKVTDWMLQAYDEGDALRKEVFAFIQAIEDMNPAAPPFLEQVYRLAGMDFPPPVDDFPEDFPS